MRFRFYLGIPRGLIRFAIWLVVGGDFLDRLNFVRLLRMYLLPVTCREVIRGDN